MKTTFLLVALLCIPTVAQNTHSDLKKGDRPVFMSARALADDCRAFLTVFPDGKPFPDDDQAVNVSVNQIVGAARCSLYIAGVQDGELEHLFGSQYHPVPTRLADMKPLIDAFLKYLADHPEEGKLAASTILDKALQLAANAQTPSKNNQH